MKIQIEILERRKRKKETIEVKLLKREVDLGLKEVVSLMMQVNQEGRKLPLMTLLKVKVEEKVKGKKK